MEKKRRNNIMENVPKSAKRIPAAASWKSVKYKKGHVLFITYLAEALRLFSILIVAQPKKDEACKV